MSKISAIRLQRLDLESGPLSVIRIARYTLRF